jgi:hypothetical protein
LIPLSTLISFRRTVPLTDTKLSDLLKTKSSQRTLEIFAGHLMIGGGGEQCSESNSFKSKQGGVHHHLSLGGVEETGIEQFYCRRG